MRRRIPSRKYQVFAFPSRALSAGALTLLLALAACQAPPPAGPTGRWSVLPAAEARLTLALRDLSGEPRRAQFRSTDGRYVEEIAEWGGGDFKKPRAGLRLSEASPGPPRTDPKDPNAIIPGWKALQDQLPAYGEPQSGQNRLGPVSWWRANLGTSECVLFLQRLAERPPRAATLSGFYCNPAGTSLSPQGAAAVVQSIGLRPRPDGQ